MIAKPRLLIVGNLPVQLIDVTATFCIKKQTKFCQKTQITSKDLNLVPEIEIEIKNLFKINEFNELYVKSFGGCGHEPR